MKCSKKQIEDYMYSKKTLSLVFVLFLSLLFVIGLMLGFGDNQFRFLQVIIALFVVYYVFYPEVDTNLVDVQFILLTIAFFLISIYKFIKNPLLNLIWDYTIYAWVVPLSYLLGKLVVCYTKKNFENRAHIVLTVISISMFIQALLNYYMITRNDGRGYSSCAFWNREKLAGRNTWDIGLMMILGGFFYSFIIRKKNKRFFVFEAIACMIAIIVALMFQGRTAPLVFLVAIVILSASYLIFDKRNAIKEYSKTIKNVALIVVLIISGLATLYIFDIAGFRKGYEESFLSRDGGIVNNIRVKWALAGINNLFNYQKGGWVNIPGEVETTHNSWLEYGRSFDIIVFSFLLLFLITTIIKDIILLYQNGEKYSVCYYAVGGKIGLIILSIINPDFYVYFDTFTIFALICGISSGIGCAAEIGDYKLFRIFINENRFKYVVPGCGILVMALMAAAYIDWWNGTLQLVILFMTPLAAYLISCLLINDRYREVLFVAGAIVCVILGVYMRTLSVKSGTLGIGLYIDPFTKGTTLKSGFIAFAIIPISLILGIILYRFQVNKVIVAIITTVISGAALIPRIMDGRLYAMREAIYLFYTVTFKTSSEVEKTLGFSLDYGQSWVNSRENVTGLISSHNMWLDFARNYGLIVFGILMGFEIWSIFTFLKLLKNNDKSYVQYALIISFILFNYHFMFEATGFSNRYVFILGMFVYGMVSTEAIGKGDSIKDVL